MADYVLTEARPRHSRVYSKSLLALAALVCVLVAGILVGRVGSSDMGPVTIAALIVILVAVVGYRLDDVRIPNRAVCVCLITLTLMFVVGVYPRLFPVFGINPSPETANIIAVGLVSLLIGVFGFTFLIRGPAKPLGVLLSHASLPNVYHVAVVTAIAVALANYFTGVIPLLADDVNASRFGDSFGVLERLWPLVIALMQSALIVGMYRYITHKVSKIDLIYMTAGSVILVLSGGRALIGVALLSCAILYIQVRRPPLWSIVLAVALGVGSLGIYGLWRAGNSTGAEAASSYLRARGLDNWSGSADLSLQTGPRVMERLLRLDTSTDGKFFSGDLGSFLRLGYDLSDRYVTGLLGADVSAVGGLPPTLFGGLYLDWGILGVIFGSVALGSMLMLFQRMFTQRPSIASALWFSYFASYFVVSAYSYISLKPTWITVAFLSIFIARANRRHDGRTAEGDS
ncbi:hypothetical protein SRABI91_00776 [Rhodococcoides fascians]|nr:hypothetical protein SRABI91_00776 [Rhodococcus fascians]